MSSNDIRRKKEKNVIYQLRARQYENKWNIRQNHSIVRALVCQDKSSFTKVWEKVSKSPIAYEGNRIYFENYRSVFVVHGHNGQPELLYRLPSCSQQHKIQDALTCEFQLNNLPMENKGYKGHLVALTRDNWLLRIDINTGVILEKVFLSQRYKFRHLGWQGEGGTIVVRSIHAKLSAMARAQIKEDTQMDKVLIRLKLGQNKPYRIGDKVVANMSKVNSHSAGIIQPLLMVLAIFSIFPLQLVAVMEVQKEIFGKDICDATISQGALIIMHQGGTVRLYSFERIVQENTIVHAKLRKMCSEVNGIIGSHPTGIPCTVKLKETPPVLFEVRCQDHNLQMGGFPWHYIFTPYRNNGVFHVNRVENKKQAANGIIDMNTMALEPDKAVFHSDESGRILHISGNTLRILKLHSCNNTTSELKESFTITPESEDGERLKAVSAQVENTGWALSSSGRIIKKRMFTSCLIPTTECIKDVDYENELDLLVVTLVTDSHDDNKTHMASVCLHDNKTGELLKQIPLEESWDETMDHTISFDLDTFVHIYKSSTSKFHCALYKLDRALGTVLQQNQEKHLNEHRTIGRRRRFPEASVGSL